MSWTINGITGRGETPACAGKDSGPAVVLGTGRRVWEDLTRFVREVLDVYDETFDLLPNYVGIVAINDMIRYFKGRVHHGVSLHPYELPLWQALRPLCECDAYPVSVHTRNWKNIGPIGYIGPMFFWDIPGATGGSSGLFAAVVALALGYDPVYLCGVPMDASGHFYDPPRLETRQFATDIEEMEWRKAKSLFFNGRVKSMSGRTREWLGGDS
jgi:hypothetical protein